ncbi:uncharacterized protein LOC125041911 [Penaeus chinensis]|uniref:uncharacterized protein LOC125041911 n=1 Tax=Penaeus chinensis TaxID=139456 RepID=UPI001FB81FC1|nr:uncharacterized protein LOC125041911 [Penaeus chinensis]XP_047493273.1 uncharacterized protein LOC125041911 [Penaeus chinensis]
MAGLVSAGSALLLLMALSTAPATEANDLDRCYCVSEFNETLRAKIAAFDPPPSPPANQYVGVEPKADDVFQSCFCQDVTRVQLVVSVTSSDWVTLAGTAENQVTLANNISDTLESYLPTLRSVSELQYTLDRFSSVTYKDTTNTEVNFDVEVLLRGHRDQSVADKLMAAVRDELTKDDLAFKTDAMVPMH